MKPIAPELEAKIDEVKLWMLEGDQKEVAKRSRTDEPRVSKVLNKRVPVNKKILEAAIEVMNENKARFEIQPKLKIA